MTLSLDSLNKVSNSSQDPTKGGKSNFLANISHAQSQKVLHTNNMIKKISPFFLSKQYITFFFGQFNISLFKCLDTSLSKKYAGHQKPTFESQHHVFLDFFFGSNRHIFFIDKFVPQMKRLFFFWRNMGFVEWYIWVVVWSSFCLINMFTFQWSPTTVNNKGVQWFRQKKEKILCQWVQWTCILMAYNGTARVGKAGWPVPICHNQ